jgi:hypothetical protein
MRVQEIWKFIHPRVLLLDYCLGLSHHRQVTSTTWIKAPKCVYTKRSLASDAFWMPLMFSCQRTITLAGKPARFPKGWNIIFISRNMIFVLCVHITPLVSSNPYYTDFDIALDIYGVNIWRCYDSNLVADVKFSGFMKRK